MKIDTKYLYELLPAYYRVVDEEKGKPLEAFIEILAREGGIVEDHITQLYENWFIETCEEWVVPYIGDLLGVRTIHEIEDASIYSRRAYIANTLGYRRRKGTAPVLEQIAFDITGWRSKVVEFFQLLSTAQNLNHIRLHNSVTADLRQMNSLDLIDTAFDSQSHTIDVRRIATGEGLHNIMNIGIFLWRLISYPMEDIDARLITPGSGVPDAAYTFSVLGLDSQLFNNAQTEKNIVHLAEEINVPGLLRRRALYEELENARQSIVNGDTPEYVYFDDAYPPVFQISANGTPIPPEETVICNLSSWRLPPAAKDYKKYETDGTISTIGMPIKAAVDPVLGRITFADPASISDVSVHCSYGFSGDLGGGPYDRKESLKDLESLNFDWHVAVSKEHTPVQGETIYQNIQDAIDDWNGSNARTGLITIMDNRTYEKGLTDTWQIDIPEGASLFILSADWPEIDHPSGTAGMKYRSPGSYNAEDLRAHLLGDISVHGTAPSASSNGGRLRLNGLLLEGKITVVDGNLDSCQIDHCTLVPYKDGIEVKSQDSIINIGLNRSVCGAIEVEATDASVGIVECIVDDKSSMAISVPEGQLAIDNSTIYVT